MSQLRRTYADTPSNTRPCPPSSRTSRIVSPQASVVSTAARRNGAGRQTLNSSPPPTSAAPIAIPRRMCWTPCERAKTVGGNTSGYSPRYGGSYT